VFTLSVSARYRPPQTVATGTLAAQPGLRSTWLSGVISMVFPSLACKSTWRRQSSTC